MAPQSAARLKANGRLKAAARNGRRVTAGPAGPTLWAAADPMLQCSSRKFLRFCRHVWLAAAARPTRLRAAWMLRRRLVLIYPFGAACFRLSVCKTVDSVGINRPARTIQVSVTTKSAQPIRRPAPEQSPDRCRPRGLGAPALSPAYPPSARQDPHFYIRFD